MDSDEERPKSPEPVLDENRVIPKYGMALAKLLEEQELEEKLELEKKQKEALNVGLPERPNKRIKEKFRLDRELMERELNAKGDSFYQSKREQMQMQNPWGQGFGSQEPPWPGWPREPQLSNSFGGWRGSSMDNESPFGRNTRATQEEENQEDYGEDTSFNKDSFGFESKYKNDAEGEDEYRSDNEGKGELSKSHDFNEDDDEFQQTETKFAKAQLNEGEDGFEEDNDQGDDNSFRNEGEGDEYEDEEDMPTMQGTDGTALAETTPDEDLDPYGRPKKKLKEKFMRDREDLEAMLNARGESIYRRPGDPPPQPRVPMDPNGGMDGPPAYQDRGRVMSANEVRAHMAFEKLARVALKAATKRKGRKGRASIVFI